MRFITNNLNVALLLATNPEFSVVIAGGTVRNRDGGVVGQSANDMIAQFRVDFAVIGISGIDEDGTLLDYDYDEVRAAQTIVRNARQVFLVADHTKFSAGRWCARLDYLGLGPVHGSTRAGADSRAPRGPRREGARGQRFNSGLASMFDNELYLLGLDNQCASNTANSTMGPDSIDLLVIGGGINGVGVARDAAARGLKVSGGGAV